MTDLKITGKNIEITDAMKDTIYDKLAFLDKFLESTDNVAVTVSVRKTKFKITIIVYAFGKVIKIEREVNDFYDGLELVVDKLKNTIRRQHEFKIKQNHEKIVDNMTDMTDMIDMIDEDTAMIEVYKTVVCDQLTEAEAIEYMETVGHDFFLFKNSEKENHFCVLYRRYDGSYGLLEDKNN